MHEITAIVSLATGSVWAEIVPGNIVLKIGTWLLLEMVKEKLRKMWTLTPNIYTALNRNSLFIYLFVYYLMASYRHIILYMITWRLVVKSLYTDTFMVGKMETLYSWNYNRVFFNENNIREIFKRACCRNICNKLKRTSISKCVSQNNKLFSNIDLMLLVKCKTVKIGSVKKRRNYSGAQRFIGYMPQASV